MPRYRHLSPYDTHIDEMIEVQTYEGSISIMIEDSKIIKETHIGNIILKLNHGFLELKNTLCVPHLRKNLISIHRLTNDFPLEFSLVANRFSLRDLQIKMTMLTDTSLGSLCHIKTMNGDVSHAYSSKVWHNQLRYPSSQVINIIKSQT